MDFDDVSVKKDLIEKIIYLEFPKVEDIGI
jgi:hypothetical protein